MERTGFRYVVPWWFCCVVDSRSSGVVVHLSVSCAFVIRVILSGPFQFPVYFLRQFQKDLSLKVIIFQTKVYVETM